jgi:aldose 1-epimerase
MRAPCILRLESGALRLSVTPSVGGAIAGFWHGGVPLMRVTADKAVRDGLVRQTSCYPLIPYSNRIAQGRFAFDGTEHELALNFGDHHHSIHGNAWQRPWHVEERSSASCRLTYRHEPSGDGTDGWPFAYRAVQTIHLDAAGATITLELTNADERAMPSGFGLHPFFPRHPDSAIRFGAAGVYRNGADSLPVHHGPVPDEWNYGTLRRLGQPGLDNCFTGWNGTAEIWSGSHDAVLRIEADPIFGHLVVYIPDERDFFAVEPVSHMNDAINRTSVPGHGLKILKPGETMTGRVHFRVEALTS